MNIKSQVGDNKIKVFIGCGVAYLGHFLVPKLMLVLGKRHLLICPDIPTFSFFFNGMAFLGFCHLDMACWFCDFTGLVYLF